MKQKITYSSGVFFVVLHWQPLFYAFMLGLKPPVVSRIQSENYE